MTESITLEVGYDRENVDKGGYRGLTQTDRYGRIIPKAAHGTVRFDAPPIWAVLSSTKAQSCLSASPTRR